MTFYRHKHKTKSEWCSLVILQRHSSNLLRNKHIKCHSLTFMSAFEYCVLSTSFMPLPRKAKSCGNPSKFVSSVKRNICTEFGAFTQTGLYRATKKLQSFCFVSKTLLYNPCSYVKLSFTFLFVSLLTLLCAMTHLTHLAITSLGLFFVLTTF